MARDPHSVKFPCHNRHLIRLWISEVGLVLPTHLVIRQIDLSMGLPRQGKHGGEARLHTLWRSAVSEVP